MPITPVPGDPMHSSGLYECLHTCSTHTHTQALTKNLKTFKIYFMFLFVNVTCGKGCFLPTQCQVAEGSQSLQSAFP